MEVIYIAEFSTLATLDDGGVIVVPHEPVAVRADSEAEAVERVTSWFTGAQFVKVRKTQCI